MEPDLLPYRAECPVARSVVVLAPHPDDEVFGCGGTLVQMQAAAVSIRQIVLTSGDRAGDASLREAESLSAGQVLGLPPPQFWRLPDRGVQVSPALVARLVDMLRSADADMLLAPSPWEVHPDHRAACQLAQEAAACVSGTLRLGFFEVGVPLRPNCLCDITSVVDLKMQAMQCFASQMALQNYADQVLALNRFRSYTLPPSVTHAEAFWFPATGPWRRGAGHGLDWVAPGGVTGGHPGQVLIPPEIPSVHVWVDGRGEATEGLALRLERLLDSLSMQTYPKVSAWVCATDLDLPQAWLGCPVHKVTPNDAWTAGAGFLLVAKPGDGLMPDHVARLVDALNRAPDARWAHADVGLRGESGALVASQEEAVPAGAVLWRAADAALLQTALSQGLQVASFDRGWMDRVGPSVRVAGVSAWLAPMPDAPRRPVNGTRRRRAWWQFWARER